jgi:hypothetical protein
MLGDGMALPNHYVRLPDLATKIKLKNHNPKSCSFSEMVFI